MGHFKAGVRWLRRGIVAAAIAALLLWAGGGDYRPTAMELAVSPYRYSVAGWEISRFSDKWLYQVRRALPWSPDRPRRERIPRVIEYFSLVAEIQSLERQLVTANSGENAAPPSPTNELRTSELRNDQLNERRRSLRSEVEETVESEITAVVAKEGFASRFGGVFPPVDTVFTRSPGVLVLSPRDRIFRQGDYLLRPGIADQEREELERFILEERDLAALVVDTGGVAAYPSVVAESSNLHWTVVTVAHEWLHHWFYFQPLGQHFWDSPEMTTLNETTAVIAGEAIGDRAYTAITGEVIDRHPHQPSPHQEPDPNAFDFNKEMRETRLTTEALLAEEKVEEAEAYMEARRLLMAQNGWHIRKINQAYFAFHGTYATSAASVSPIEAQLRELQAHSDSLGDFLKTVASFSNYKEFLDFLAALGEASDN